MYFYGLKDICLDQIREMLYAFNRVVGTNGFYDINFTKLNNELYGILLDMCSNIDQRFKIDLMSNFGLNFVYKSALICNYLKMYMLLKGYESNKNNYDNYKEVLDDVLSLENEWNVDYRVISNNFKFVKPVVDLIVSNKFYKDMPNSRELLKDVYKEVLSPSLISYDYFKWFDDCKKIFDDALEAGIDKKRASYIFDKSLEEHYASSFYDNPYLYSKILLFGDRFDYVNEKLIEIEGNYSIRKDIFSRIKNLSIELFDDLNESRNNKDSFITCMDIVFDSDSYYELLSKLNCLNDASNLYLSGKRKEAYDLLKDLSSLRHKKRYCDEVVAYQNNCINLIEKPKTVFRREKELYARIDNSISYDFMEELHYKCSDVASMMRDTDFVINRENKFLKKIKRKIWSNLIKTKE